MYLVEISPPQSTGFFGTLNQLAISFGIALGSLLGVVPSRSWDVAWYVMTAFGSLICLLSSVLIWVIPESPAVSEPRAGRDIHPDDDNLFSETWLIPMATVLLMSFFQQTTGINPLFSVANDYRYVNDTVMQVLPVFAHVLGALVGAFFIEYLGRRLVWVISLGCIAGTDLIHAICALRHAPDTVIVVDLFVNMFLFGFGAGPIPWFVVSEFFPVPIRPLAGSFMAMSNWLFAAGSMVGYGLLDDAAQNWSWLFFTGFSIVATFFGVFFIRNPEVQAKEELYQNLYDGVVAAESR
jgi:SP family facilitated glucose transporter-like MFS transporter 8